jgi:hypothetical protein
MNFSYLFAIASLGCALSAMVSGEVPWTAIAGDGRVEAALQGKSLLAWQLEPLRDPKGGAKFAGSAFLHPLRTPSGFEWTQIQPDDHKHHFGVWWPWKFVEVNGKTYNCWEIQEGQGAHVAKSAKPLESKSGALAWEFVNELVIKPPGAEPKAVIHEQSTVSIFQEKDACVLDVAIHQQAVDVPVKILNYRYSGFSWRGTAAWNKGNSTLLTSGGKGRQDANGTECRWVLVSGTSPAGMATVLIMSDAATPEKLRVWDASAHNGAPFINFNPVQDQALPLDDAHPAVSKRKYRIIAADHLIGADEAEAAWKSWTGR